MKCHFNLKNTIPPPCKVNAINFEYKQFNLKTHALRLIFVP